MSVVSTVKHPIRIVIGESAPKGTYAKIKSLLSDAGIPAEYDKPVFTLDEGVSLGEVFAAEQIEGVVVEGGELAVVAPAVPPAPLATTAAPAPAPTALAAPSAPRGGVTRTLVRSMTGERQLAPTPSKR